MEKYRTHVVYNINPEILEYFRSIRQKYAVLVFENASGTFHEYQVFSTYNTLKEAETAAEKEFWQGRTRVTVWKKEGEKITNENGHEMKGLSIEKIR